MGLRRKAPLARAHCLGMWSQAFSTMRERLGRTAPHALRLLVPSTSPVLGALREAHQETLERLRNLSAGIPKGLRELENLDSIMQDAVPDVGHKISQAEYAEEYLRVATELPPPEQRSSDQRVELAPAASWRQSLAHQ